MAKPFAPFLHHSYKVQNTFIFLHIYILLIKSNKTIKNIKQI